MRCNGKRVFLNCSRQWGKSTVLAASQGASGLLSTPNGKRGFFYREWSLPEIETLIEELTSMRGFDRKRGRTLEAPGRKHDDLSLAWWGVEARHPGTLGVDKRLL